MNKVKFNLKSKKEETTLVVLNYRFFGNKLVMSTGLTILVKDWNLDKQRIRTVKGKPEYYSYNNHLDKMERAVIDAVNDFNKKSIQPTVLKLKTKVKELLDGKIESTQKFNSLYHYSKAYIEQLEAEETLKKRHNRWLQSIPKGSWVI